jgi:hypothetical protein
MEQPSRKKENINIKVEEYVKRWIKLLKDIKPSKKGFSERTIREDRESH